MKSILFINFPVHGHVNPQIKMCRELAKKPCKLYYMTFEKYFHKFEGIDNIELIPYTDAYYQYYTALQSNMELHEKFSALLYVFNTLAEKIMPFVVEKTKQIQPDLIICDSLAIHGKMVARYLDIPYVLFFSSFMGDGNVLKNSPKMLMKIIQSSIFDSKYLFEYMKISRRLKQQYGPVTEDMRKVMDPGDRFTVVNCSREFHPGGDNYGENVHFAQPEISHINNQTVKKDKILISVGTISFSDEFWDICLEATRDLPYDIVMTFGDNPKNVLKTTDIPSNVHLHDYLPLDDFRQTLKESVLFISHGGYNSILDSILAKTPLLICPITAEQASNGAMLEDMGCAKLFRGKLTADRLRQVVQTIISTKDMDGKINNYRKSLIEAESYDSVLADLDRQFSLFTPADSRPLQ